MLFCEDGRKSKSWETGIEFKGRKGRLIHLFGYNIVSSPWVNVLVEIDTIKVGSSDDLWMPTYAKINRQTLDTYIKLETENRMTKYKYSLSTKEIVIEIFKTIIASVKKKNKI